MFSRYLNELISRFPPRRSAGRRRRADHKNGAECRHFAINIDHLTYAGAPAKIFVRGKTSRKDRLGN